VQTTGILEDDKFMDEIGHKEGVLYARPLVPRGHKCVCADDGLPTWIGEMMFTKAPVEEAIEFVKQVEEEIIERVRIVPL
jgi:hypothetical protein